MSRPGDDDLEAALARRPGWIAETDLAPAIAARVAVPRRRAARWPAVAAGLAVAAALVLVWRLPGGAPGEAPPQPKGGASPAEGGDRWVGVELYAPGDPPTPVGAQVPAPAGELLIAYTNLGPSPYPYLMVFAIDALGEVRWYYPAYERAGTDPAAIAIAPAVADRLLPDAIAHPLPPGKLTLCGVFLRAPRTVLEVEAALRDRRPGERLALPDSAQDCRDRSVR